jgi:hypothetical protein
MIARSVIPTSIVAAAACALAAACSSDTSPTSPGNSSPVAVAAQFNHLGDSVMASGGTSADAAPFYGAAGVVGLVPEISTLSIKVDGADVKFNTIAIAVEISGGPMIACPLPPTSTGWAAPYVCPWGIPRLTRTLFAWQPGRPTQIVTLVAMVDSGPIGTPLPLPYAGANLGPFTPRDSATSAAAAAAVPIPAHLEFWDAGHLWWGIGGTQTNSVRPNGKECPPPPTATADAPRAGVIPRGSCQLADFTFSFSGKVSAPPFPWRANGKVGTTSAATTHELVLGRATLTGAYLKLALFSAAPGQ